MPRNRFPQQKSNARTICVVFDLMFDAHRRKLRGVLDYARRAGWDIEVAGSYLAPELSAPEDYNAYDGIIIDRRPTLLSGEWKDVRRPFVVIDGGPDDVVSPQRADVRCEDVAVGTLAAQTLHALGAASYAFVPGFPPDDWSSRRGGAYIKALRGLGPDAEAYEPVCRDRDAVHLAAECAHLAEWLAARPRPAAVFAANDAVATFVYAACRRAELSIPDDVFVLGVDNDETVCECSRPTLSSILMDFEACGRHAAELLDALLRRQDATAGRQRNFSPISVVHRASTRPRLPQADARLARALDLIDREACHGLTVSALARAFGISRRSLELLFLPLGETPAHRIAETRLRRVHDLLLSTSLPITRIASDCGFSSVVYLAALFKARYGSTMTDLRKKALAGIKSPLRGFKWPLQGVKSPPAGR